MKYCILLTIKQPNLLFKEQNLHLKFRKLVNVSPPKIPVITDISKGRNPHINITLYFEVIYFNIQNDFPSIFFYISLAGIRLLYFNIKFKGSPKLTQLAQTKEMLDYSQQLPHRSNSQPSYNSKK